MLLVLEHLSLLTNAIVINANEAAQVTSAYERDFSCVEPLHHRKRRTDSA